MLILIIPTLPIFHGHCVDEIEGVHGEIPEILSPYSANPVERVRLLRKENAKTVHLEFWDSNFWMPENVQLIRCMREAVDIPFELWMRSLPPSTSVIEPVFEAGVNRIFLPTGVSDEVLFEYITAFTARKIVLTTEMDFPFEEKLPLYRTKKLERIAVEISSRDQLDGTEIDWERLAQIAELAKQNRMRITIMHGIKGYPDLRELQTISPVIDSLVLCQALCKNRFPCQLIWREVEEDSAREGRATSNLWVNPLEGKPHV